MYNKAYALSLFSAPKMSSRQMLESVSGRLEEVQKTIDKGPFFLEDFYLVKEKIMSAEKGLNYCVPNEEMKQFKQQLQTKLEMLNEKIIKIDQSLLKNNSKFCCSIL